jgi:hypothetical protein
MGREYSPSGFLMLAEVSLGAVCVLGLLLNALVAVRLGRRRFLTSTWAACNVLVLLKTPLLVATVHTGHWPMGELPCRLYLAGCALQLWAPPWLLALNTIKLCSQVDKFTIFQFLTS